MSVYDHILMLTEQCNCFKVFAANRKINQGIKLHIRIYVLSADVHWGNTKTSDAIKKTLAPPAFHAQTSEGTSRNLDTTFQRTDRSVGGDFIPVHLESGIKPALV